MKNRNWKSIVVSLLFIIITQGCINQKVTESEVFNPIKEYPLDKHLSFQRYFIDNTDTTQLELWHIMEAEPEFNIIYLSGNGSNVRSAIPFFNEFTRQAEVNIFTFNYSGYGLSDGKPTIQGIVNDGQLALDFFNNHLNNGLPTLLLGYSMGGYVALNLSGDHSIDQVVIMSTFTSLEELEDYLIKDALPWIVRPFIKLDIDKKIYNLNNKPLAEKAAKPTLVIHGAADNFIPPSMGKTLYDLIPTSDKKFVTISNADHRMVLKDQEKMKEVIQEILDFIEQNKHFALD
ncbi:MAG: alpha/beta hydrolase [Bacteroidales bacterium]|jgi:pimeloyl-ACP methyl ester carboxylesterase|nr:alpha/beta hydrolase [Bacteroidales bacterium]